MNRTDNTVTAAPLSSLRVKMRWSCARTGSLLARWLAARKHIRSVLGNANKKYLTIIALSGLDLMLADEAPVCNPEATCPTPCTCKGNVVDCRDKGLAELPHFFPDDTTEM